MWCPITSSQQSHGVISPPPVIPLSSTTCMHLHLHLGHLAEAYPKRLTISIFVIRSVTIHHYRYSKDLVSDVWHGGEMVGFPPTKLTRSQSVEEKAINGVLEEFIQALKVRSRCGASGEKSIAASLKLKGSPCWCAGVFPACYAFTNSQGKMASRVIERQPAYEERNDVEKDYGGAGERLHYGAVAPQSW